MDKDDTALDASGWLDPQWRAAAVDWVTGRLREQRRSVVGEVRGRHPASPQSNTR